MSLPKMIKLFQIIKKLQGAQEFDLEIRLGMITRKKNKAIVLLACDTST